MPGAWNRSEGNTLLTRPCRVRVRRTQRARMHRVEAERGHAEWRQDRQHGCNTDTCEAQQVHTVRCACAVPKCGQDKQIDLGDCMGGGGGKGAGREKVRDIEKYAGKGQSVASPVAAGTNGMAHKVQARSWSLLYYVGRQCVLERLVINCCELSALQEKGGGGSW
jgi:hypothetical protein